MPEPFSNKICSDSLLVYSLPGTKEHIVATISSMQYIEDGIAIQAFDFVFAPFDKSVNASIGINISSYAASRKFSCIPVGQPLEEESTSCSSYAIAFERVMQLLEEDKMDKIVLSRIMDVKHDYPDLYDLYMSVKNTYMEAFTYLLHIPGSGTWMGASPELVLKHHNGQYFSRAIAGTKVTGSNVAWTDKEVNEHRYIETYLRKALTSSGIPFKISSTYTLEAGPVSHICSDLVIQQSSNETMDHVLDIIHPGPALSGLPKAAAIDHIRNVEQHNRKFYCGYFGLTGKTGDAILYANIRCMQIFKVRCRLYLGGGITEASVLENEWKETENKAMTLLNLMTYESVE